ncbi:MAG: dephospho-CoA kinase [Burkholderiales bacterium]|nr:dephospho-CoA kinase [Burkholderiales bacterium]MDQ3196635.1 dephospho-CoA kinase [Pseudomonadota bacterium]
MPFTVGLTGGIGCGKSRAADFFGELGAGIVDTDVISHHLTLPGTATIAAIRRAFGDDFFEPDGTLNRSKLRSRVFSDARARSALESILHPEIRRAAETEVGALKTPYGVLVVPLLLETSALRELVDRVLLVDCAEHQQIERTVRRGLAENDVRAIMASQLSRSERLGRSDDIIDNSAGPEELKLSVQTLHERYLEMAYARGATPAVNL